MCELNLFLSENIIQKYKKKRKREYWEVNDKDIFEFS